MKTEYGMHFYNRPTVLFLTRYFTRFPYVGGPIGERYVGLYNTFIELFFSEYDFYWYDEEKMRLYRFVNRRYKAVSNRFLPAILLRLIQNSIRKHNQLLVVVCYPSACYKPSFLASLVFLLAFKFLNAIKVILDVVDVPAYVGRETGKWKVTFLSLHEFFCVKMASRLIVTSETWNEYFFRKKLIHRRQEAFIIPMGSFHRLIKPMYRSSSKGFTLIYVGSVVRERGIEKLVKCIENVRRKRNDVRLIIATAGTPKIPLPKNNWLQVFNNVPTYLHMIELLSRADACVIPYPPGSYWDGTFIAKLSVYMASGKPILSTNLPETKKILQKLNCGLVARDWEEMEDLIIKLCKDHNLLSFLGRNARAAAEKTYNWETCARALNTLVKNVLVGD